MSYKNYEGKALEYLEYASTDVKKGHPTYANLNIYTAIVYALLSISQQINMIDNQGQK